MDQYTAGLSRSQGRSAWSIIFRHPLRFDRQGRPGRRVRRGLGTSDQDEAQRLVDQMNKLLRDKALWDPAARTDALRRYDRRIVDAFYDDLVPTTRDPWTIRECEIPFPKDSNRVLMVGTTGAGKTTVVRQLIGTNPKTERFPSTSAAKTTISDIEIILTDAPFQGVITFLSEHETQQYIEDCVAAAVMIACEGGSVEEVARKLLEHREQRFRLSYVLGTLPSSSLEEDEEDESAGDESDSIDADDVEISPEERQEFVQRLQAHLDDINVLAETIRRSLSSTLDFSEEGASKRDKEAFQELIEDDLYQREEFLGLVDRLVDEVKQRFGFLIVGNLEQDVGGWPVAWTWMTSDRAAFIKAVNRFSSNYAPNFGKLLTPLVNGIRVCGPFKPDWNGGAISPLVLMDGEGLGHTPDSAASLSTSVTRRFELADTILLVDNGMAPMQAAPGAVLRNLVISGHSSKLAIGFTHVDQVRGDNLPTTTAKRAHILGSLDNMIANVCRDLGRGAESSLRRALTDRSFFLANIQKLKVKGPTLDEFHRLMDLIVPVQSQPLLATPVVVEPTLETALERVPAVLITLVPQYDDARLVWYIQKAIQEFRETWRARMGLDYRSGIDKEHWSRTKALTRYIGFFGWDEYHSLRPVGDLIRFLTTQVYVFLREECRWFPNGDIDEEGVAYVAREVSSGLHRIVRQMLITNQVLTWQRAYGYRGAGSTMVRAREIDGIYSNVIPLLSEMMSIKTIPLEADVRRLVRESIDTYSKEVADDSDDSQAHVTAITRLAN